MKKAITILAILAIVVAAVFAVDPEPDPAVRPAGKERITVETQVDRTLPVLRLLGSLDESAWETSTTVAQTGYSKEKAVTPADVEDISARANNGTILDAKSIDISHEDLTVYFKVTSAEARCDLVYNIAVSATQLKAVDNNTTYTIASEPTFAHQAAGTPVTNLAVSVVEGETSAFTATATYSGFTEEATIGTFDITWEKDNYAPEATYRADVTMVYTVQ